LTLHDVELDFFLVAQAAQILVRVVFRNCRLMHEDIFVGIRAIDETIAVLDIEPFHFTFHARGQHFLFLRHFDGRRVSSRFFVGHIGVLFIQ
jgi:hypothetical protein